nr:coiled-coil domain-containing protein 106-like [Misgurnus anguillicaudatus]
MMSSGQMDDILDSCHQTRWRPKKKQSKDERTEKPDKPPGAAPTFSIALAKAKAETDTLRVKCQHLQEKIEDLTKERDFLRQQLSEAIKMDNMPDKNKDNPADIAKKIKISQEYSESDPSDSESSDTSDSESCSSDSSREKKKRKKKAKKVKKRVKKNIRKTSR